MQRLGPPDERVDERLRDVVEHAADHRFEDVRREFVGELELDLARILGKGTEPPLAMQVMERAVEKTLTDRKNHTADIGGSAKTAAVGDAVAKAITRQ